MHPAFHLDMQTDPQTPPKAQVPDGASEGASEGVRETPDPEQLLISAQPFETRLAVLSGGRLHELHVTPVGGESNVGTIALGKVMRVLPGMQAAFVELGLARPGFLHARDIERPVVAEDGSTVDARDIRTLVHEGQVLPVQVTKDPIASKGARLTTNLALPSRLLVLTADNNHIGVSQRIHDDNERDRLRQLVGECAAALGMPAAHGFIVRTAAEGAQREEFSADMQSLLALWQALEAKRVSAKTGDALFQDLPTHIRVLRDLVGPQTTAIRVDAPEVHAAVLQFAETSLPGYSDAIHLAPADKPLFESFGVEQQIRSALKPRVGLSSGGYLIIEQTEAMITIDVNTGGFTGSSSLEDTVFKTNMEAALALPRQLRLRNLGGLIVVDFIDMESRVHRDAVVMQLQAGCAADSARVRIARMSEFGLVEMSRKRTRESLARQFCEPCKPCAGTGMVLRPATVVFEILRSLAANAAAGKRGAGSELLLIAAPPVIDRLLAEDAAHLAQVTKSIGCAVRLQADPAFAVTNWELVQQQAP